MGNRFLNLALVGRRAVEPGVPLSEGVDISWAVLAAEDWKGEFFKKPIFLRIFLWQYEGCRREKTEYVGKRSGNILSGKFLPYPPLSSSSFPFLRRIHQKESSPRLGKGRANFFFCTFRLTTHSFPREKQGREDEMGDTARRVLVSVGVFEVICFKSVQSHYRVNSKRCGFW